MAVIEGNSDAIESKGGEESGVRVCEEIFQESIEEILILFRAENGQHSLSMLELRSRKTCDEILHVEVAAESGTLENDLVSIPVNNSGAADTEDRVNWFS
jgi:hypothetical protein